VDVDGNFLSFQEIKEEFRSLELAEWEVCLNREEERNAIDASFRLLFMDVAEFLEVTGLGDVVYFLDPFLVVL
jgi:hypothetical protein